MKVGALTGISRIFGFIRDMLIANVLGAGRLSDIFFMAFKIPNLFRNLLAEGALQVAFVPMFTEHRDDKKTSTEFSSNAFSWLMCLLLFITLAAEIAMPFIIMLFAPGFASDPEKLEMTIWLSRIMFLYLFFISGTAFLTCILNAFSEFALTTAMPIVLNTFMIIGLLIAKHSGYDQLNILSWAVVLSGIVQMGILFYRIKKRKMGLHIIRPKLTPRIKTLFKRMIPGFIGTGAYHINILAGSMIASFQDGAVSWLYYADRMVQLPFAMIGLAAGTVLLTSISSSMCRGDMNDVYDQQNSSIKHILFWTLPALVGLLILTIPIIKLLFEHGAFDHTSTINTSNAIFILAFVLPAMSLSQIFSNTLYASQDTKTPVHTSVTSLLIGIVLSAALFPIFGFLSVAVGTMVGGWVKLLTLIYHCYKRKLFKLFPRTIRTCSLFTIIAITMGFMLAFANKFGLTSNLFGLFGTIAVAGLFYLGTNKLLLKFIK